MAMYAMRAPSMLPSIKCSNCAVEIEISSMGDHICEPQDYQAPPPRSKPSDRIGSIQFFEPFDEQRHLKPDRSIPAKIDSWAANQPFSRKDVYASNSPRTASSRSPVSPLSVDQYSASSQYRAQYEQQRRPSRPERKPSVEHSQNLDCAFPPFPASPMASTPRSGHSSPDFFSNSIPVTTKPQQTKPAPRAPEPSTTMPARQLRAEQPPPRSVTPASQLGRDEAKRDEFFSRSKSVTKPRAENQLRGLERSAYQEQDRRAPSRPGRPGGEVDNFIAQLKEDTRKPTAAVPVGMRAEKRSNTFPRENTERSLERTPSEPLHNMSRRPPHVPERSATTNDLRYNTNNTNNTNNTSQRYPTRSSSRGGSRPSVGSQDVPAMSFNGYSDSRSHGPSYSGSSAGSSVSGVGSAMRTGRSTPMSEVSATDNKSPPRTLHNARNPYAYNNEPVEPAAYVPKAKPYQTSPAAEHPEMNPYAPVQPSQQTRQRLPWSMSMDAPAPPQDNYTYTHAPQQDLYFRPSLERSPTDQSIVSSTTAASSKPRHTCRGCHTPIQGKSIRAADGRLTGRYHRQCFVCSTCSAPFASAQFYVHSDKPYCEYHYHALNASLCAHCDRGIEGRFLETEEGERKKFHPGCLCCSTCREVLGEEYFDVGGKVYCERHAVSEVRRLGAQGGGRGQQGGGAGFLGQGMGSPGGGWKAERRRTRMGMMQPSFIGI